MNLKQLSKKLGLSQTTVSRALNGYPEVSAATRARVNQAAQEYRYSPNISARNLATGQATAIGHVIPVATQYEIVNPIFSDLISGASTVYAENGYELVLSIVENADEEEVYRKLKARGTVAGVIVHAPEMADNRVELLKRIQLPFAVHGRVTSYKEPYCWVDVDNRSAFRRATNLLLDLGHLRIGLINGIETKDFAFRRRQGYEDALSARKQTLDPALMRSGKLTEEEGYNAVIEMLSLENPPTAFLVSSMVSAFGARRGIEDLGLVIGRDISVITHDDELSYLKNSGESPIFTSTRSSVREAGRRLAENLIHLINNPGQQPRQELLKADLQIGRSTGPVPQVSAGVSTLPFLRP